MTRKEYEALMAKLHGEIGEIEAKMADSKDEAKTAAFADMIAGKQAEFEAAQKQVEALKAKDGRQAIIDGLRGPDGTPAVESKTGELGEEPAAVADSAYNDEKNARDIDAKRMEYLFAPKREGHMEVLGKMDGRMLSVVRPSDSSMEGVLLPRAMQAVIAPQPTGEDMLRRTFGSKVAEQFGADLGAKTEYDVLVSDASGSQSGGGSLVPNVFEPNLYKIPQYLDDIPNRCWVKRGVGKNALYPKLTQSSTEPFGITVTKGAEGAAITEHDPVFTLQSVGTNRASVLSYASLKEMRNNKVGLAGQIAWMYKGALSRKMSHEILLGGGSTVNENVGVNTQAAITLGVLTVGRETASQVSYVDLSKLQFAIERGIFDEGVYVLSTGADSAMQYIASLDDTHGRPIFPAYNQGFAPGVGQVPAIAGRPYIHTPANTRDVGQRGDVIYGDFRQYALVIDEEMSIERSDHYAFNLGVATFRLIAYYGGEPLGYSCFSVLADVAGMSSSSSSSS